MARVKQYSPNTFGFFCPGCQCDHVVGVSLARTESAGNWAFNDNFEFPTFTPSILVFGGYPEIRCHSFVREGKIQFLPDCFHALAGQTVEIPNWE